MSSATAQHALATDWPQMMLRRVDPTRNMSRFWSVRLQPSLFEEVLLVRNWGRIGSRGQERSYWFSTRQAALAAFEKITSAKRRRGYATQLTDAVMTPIGLDVDGALVEQSRQRSAAQTAESKPYGTKAHQVRLASIFLA